LKNTISVKTLKMMDEAAKHLAKGEAGEPLDMEVLDELVESFEDGEK
jgi:hypothetical protein